MIEKRRRPMKGREARGIIEGIAATQAEAARAVGMSDRNMRRYLADAQPIPEPVAKLLRAIQQGKLTFDEVDAL